MSPGHKYNETLEYTLYTFWHSKLSQTSALVCCATNIKLVWNIYAPPTQRQTFLSLEELFLNTTVKLTY